MWCSDKKLADRPDRLHYFDLTISTVEDTGPLQVQITRIGDIDPLSPSHLKPTKYNIHYNLFFSMYYSINFILFYFYFVLSCLFVCFCLLVCRSYLFGTTKDRNHLLLKFSSADMAKEWKIRLKKEISHARCQVLLF